jgi:hypothetical protein
MGALSLFMTLDSSHIALPDTKNTYQSVSVKPLVQSDKLYT